MDFSPFEEVPAQTINNIYAVWNYYEQTIRQWLVHHPTLSRLVGLSDLCFYIYPGLYGIIYAMNMQPLHFGPACLCGVQSLCWQAHNWHPLMTFPYNGMLALCRFEGCQAKCTYICKLHLYTKLHYPSLYHLILCNKITWLVILQVLFARFALQNGDWHVFYYMI